MRVVHINHLCIPEMKYVILGNVRRENVRFGRCHSGNCPSGKCHRRIVCRGNVRRGKVRQENVRRATVLEPYKYVITTIERKSNPLS